MYCLLYNQHGLTRDHNSLREFDRVVISTGRQLVAGEIEEVRTRVRGFFSIVQDFFTRHIHDADRGNAFIRCREWDRGLESGRSIYGIGIVLIGLVPRRRVLPLGPRWDDNAHLLPAGSLTCAYRAREQGAEAANRCHQCETCHNVNPPP